MSSLRAGENVLMFPSIDPEVDISPLSHLRVRPGQFIAILDPPRFRSKGGVLLLERGDGWSDPHVGGLELAEAKFEGLYAEWETAMRVFRADKASMRNRQRAIMLSELATSAYENWKMMEERREPGAALDLRSDAYTVASVGPGVPLVPGDRVIGAPYAPWRFKEMCGVPDVCVFGVQDPWEDIVPFIWWAEDETWKLANNWLGVKISVKSHSVITKRTKYHRYGQVAVHGPLSTLECGEFVVMDKDRGLHRPDDSKWFGSKFGPWDDNGVIFVREVDSDGTRRILGTMEIAQ